MTITGTFGGNSPLFKQGLILNLTDKSITRFEKVFSIFKFKEKSKPLPEADYVLMFKTSYAACHACSLVDTEEPMVNQLSLVYNKNKKLIIHESKNFEEIQGLAKQIAQSLNLTICDSATDRRNPKWVHLQT